MFDGALSGLMIAEVEFDDDEAMFGIVPPQWCGAEVTDNADLVGARLARLANMPSAAASAALSASLAAVHCSG